MNDSTAAYLTDLVRRIFQAEVRKIIKEEVAALRFPVWERSTLTVEEVSALMKGLKRTKVFQLIREGKLTKVGLEGQRTVVSRESVSRYLASKGVRLVRNGEPL